MQPLREIALYFGFVQPTDDERRIEAARGPSYRALRFLAVMVVILAVGGVIAVLVQLLL